jgi:hypothetical protein
MARSIYCLYCGDKMKKLSAKYGEDYRTVEGELKVDCKCDGCSKSLAAGTKVIAFTSHPQGAHVVMPWESEFIKKESTMTAHELLIRDLVKLTKKASKLQFHCYKSQASATPKLLLVRELNEIMEKCKDGMYDDLADDSDRAELKKACLEGGFTEEQAKTLFDV